MGSAQCSPQVVLQKHVPGCANCCSKGDGGNEFVFPLQLYNGDDNSDDDGGDDDRVKEDRANAIRRALIARASKDRASGLQQAPELSAPGKAFHQAASELSVPRARGPIRQVQLVSPISTPRTMTFISQPLPTFQRVCSVQVAQASTHRSFEAEPVLAASQRHATHAPSPAKPKPGDGLDLSRPKSPKRPVNRQTTQNVVLRTADFRSRLESLEDSD